ncbi:pentapeptide repeat-containing protein [Streptomyces lunaelactis]|uniref:pentapeptide repeat-containing protein n=1 Tax=Streptomyces lunaelactis TaxID=1535768 RepID=UPI001584DDEA|nr:pentapeptide repeat-containing protein [Streptomyces lunaelactis]NUK09496.1 pentapeptide repeat-containing protein [Streptomyces lunaelactis]NUK73373.1 pentapeptide repeat-containing protein [Streptomyces lunaelactis]NUL24512.1 pentapeptide repeat-containing protein [Streptomyces lunaelactis]
MALPLRRRQAPRGRYTPNLWSVWLVAPLALVVVGALSFGLYHGVFDLLANAASKQKPRKPVNINDVIKTTVTVLTLIGAVLAGIYAYRKQLLAEGDAHRADASQLADRYTTAAEQLGHDQPAVRLAGVYALAHLADEWTEQRQVCIDVLCAYLRMPYTPDPAAPDHKPGEREVRQTIIRVIRDHLNQPGTPTSWSAYHFNFTGATFDRGNFSHSHFRGRVTFDGARFDGGTVTFNGARFDSGRVTFDGARFDGGRVTFDGARFDGGTVTFNGARFDGGTVTFNEARFDGGTVTFNGARFDHGTVSFEEARFDHGTVSFNEAAFFGATVSFNKAAFTGGTVSFNKAAFVRRAGVSFNEAAFSGGRVSFNEARLDPMTTAFPVNIVGVGVSFNAATFSGTVFDWGPLRPPPGA